ncbi:MAG: enoyl-CoA hydratase [Acidimicrobiales bacterium]|nr:enoyl-CoA hydratase [Acidimicrobiales bacterium]
MFSSSGDDSYPGNLDLLERLPVDGELRAAATSMARRMMYGVTSCSKPVIAVQHEGGVSMGAFGVITFIADVSIVARTARIAELHLALLSLPPGDQGALIWPLNCGLAKARYYLMSGDELSGEEAERIGLVSLCEDEAHLDAKALAVATRFAAMGPSGMAATKRCINEALRKSMLTFDYSLAASELQMQSPEYRESVSALKEKRAPRY